MNRTVIERELIGSELDLVAELERLAATECESFLELEKSQAESADRIASCIDRLGRREPTERLASICQQALREQAVLMDVDYLCERSKEVLARDSVLAPGLRWQSNFPMDHAWVTERVGEALEDILMEDEELYTDGGQDLGGCDSHHHCLVYSYGIDPRYSLTASVRFHRLAQDTRECFFALVVEQRSVERCVADGLGPQFRLKMHVQNALNALLFLEDVWPTQGVMGSSREEADHG